MPSLGWRIRAGALIALGALGVHDIRYLLAYGSGAGHELSLQGHGYLRLATPLVAGLVVLAAAAFAARVMRAYAVGEEGERRALPSTRRLWGFASALLVCVYASQEWVEGTLASGHPGGIGAPFSHGGWVAIPLALVIGLLIALALRGAAAAIAVAAARGRARLRRPAAAPSPLLLAGSASLSPRRAPLARRLAPRAPPAFV
ncbi:MAG TPA: hypothetical protein VF032_12985 [Thermoleophilaceae bacterium]